MQEGMSDSSQDLRFPQQCLLALLLAPLEAVTFSPSSFSFGDHFEWNKVTSCIHNILSGQRWIEHYGEIVIKNVNDDSCHCKVNFIKVTWDPGSSSPAQPPRAGPQGTGCLGNFHPHSSRDTGNARGPLVLPHPFHLDQGTAPPGPLPFTFSLLWSILRAAARGVFLRYKSLEFPL